ncbi:MAG: SAM-dependent methyltransferase [Muribaculaceae bacterium]|nr:SAM-dependent methyltransferase [Muribaculaceae bacterium]
MQNNQPLAETTGISLTPALYLIPSDMSEGTVDSVIPPRNLHILSNVRHFIVENVREARRFIRRALPQADISGLHFEELNRHTDLNNISHWLDPLRQGLPVGLLSDAGCPAVADPGAVIVDIAQREHLKVVPLVGPSSILLGLMASGFNGQGFTFHGYLPIDERQRVAAIRALEDSSSRHDMTHIFIETPYRNNRLLRTLIANLRDDTRICVAADLTHPTDESVISQTVSRWKTNINNTDYDKRPAVFLIYAGHFRAARTHAGQKNAYRRKA